MPIRGLAARLEGKEFFIEEPAADVVPADGQGFDTLGLEAIELEIGHVGGTQGSVAVTIEHADTADVNANYSTVAAGDLEFRQLGSASFKWDANPKTFTFLTNGNGTIHRVGYCGGKRWVRIKTSGAAGTPNFKISGRAQGSRKRHNRAAS